MKTPAISELVWTEKYRRRDGSGSYVEHSIEETFARVASAVASAEREKKAIAGKRTQVFDVVACESDLRAKRAVSYANPVFQRTSPLVVERLLAKTSAARNAYVAYCSGECAVTASPAVLPAPWSTST